MEVAFVSKDIRRICEDEVTAKKALGESIAALLKRRLADMRAAVNLGDLIAGRPRACDKIVGSYLVDLDFGYIVRFTPNHLKKSMKVTIAADWKKVGRVKITDIEEQ